MSAIDSSLRQHNIDCPPLKDQLTVEAWVDADEPRAEVMQPLVSKWRPGAGFGHHQAYDAGRTDGLVSEGYFGAVFDGRYIYFAPEHRACDLRTHGIILRYDTHGEFTCAGSYAAYDAGKVAGLETRGFYGAAFDGNYVYFVPRQIDMNFYHSHLLRLDATRDFKDAAAWDAFDINERHSSQGCAFDGRYLYLCPGFSDDPSTEKIQCGKVIRYDTNAPFKSRDSYETFDVAALLGPRARCFDGGAFDGRYIYFVPLMNGAVIRYDTFSSLTDGESWQMFDARQLGMEMCVGAVYDGRYLYFVAYENSKIVRFDTCGNFEESIDWQVRDVDHIDGLRTNGFDGGFYDGRYVYFVPFVYPRDEGGYEFHSNYLRLDTTADFDDPGAWSASDASRASDLHSVGYNAGAFDGRYFYAAPWRNRPGFGWGREVNGIHGVVLRTDTLGDEGSFSLRYCDYGHNGGLCAATPGPSLLVNTTRGVLNIASHQPLPAGRHYLAGTYDGHRLRLFVDGALAAQREGYGDIVNNEVPITVGAFDGGNARFRGEIVRICIAAQAFSAPIIASRAAGPRLEAPR